MKKRENEDQCDQCGNQFVDDEAVCEVCDEHVCENCTIIICEECCPIGLAKKIKR